MNPEAPGLASAHGPYAGKSVLVTGATQGIGEAVARLLVERGATQLTLVGRRRDAGERLVAELTSHGATAQFVSADLSRAEDCFAAVDAAVGRFGHVDSLFCCAGASLRGSVLDTTPELWDYLFALNARAPFLMLQRAVPSMRERGGGSAVFVGSMASHGGQPYLCAYSAAKGALLTFTRNAAYALCSYRIRVNLLNLGWCNTPGENTVQREILGRDEQWLERAMGKQPFGRLVEPTDVARALAFLGCDEAGIMTGSIVDFDQTVLGTGGGHRPEDWLVAKNPPLPGAFG